jgi:hypothetical protein
MSLPILTGITLLLMPVAAAAQVSALDSIITTIVSGTPLSTTLPSVGLSCAPAAGNGACALASMLVFAVQRSRFIVGWLAFLVIVIAGFRLIISQSEDALTTARRTIMAAVIGLFLIFATEPLVDAFYGGYTIIPPSGAPTAPFLSAAILSDELLGILRWGETLVAIVAVTMLIVQAIAVLGSFGQEEVIRKAYRAVYSTVIGLLLIVFDRSIAALFGYASLSAIPNSPNPNIFIVEVFGLVRFLLFFVVIVVVAVIVYAGFLMLLHFGNDDWITKGKGILVNAGLGLLLIVVSFVIVSAIILGI